MRISETQFFIDRDNGIGLQVQLRERIAASILARRFLPGQRLPSSRKLADYLGIARITVSLVYQDLVADGYLAAAPRSGFFVAEDAPDLIAAPSRPAREADRLDWSARLSNRYSGLRRVEKPLDWRAYLYPFTYGQIDPKLFPHEDWRDCARRALGKRDFDQVAGDAIHSDDPRLVSHILSHSLPARGITAESSDVLVTLGAQNALWLVVQILSAGGQGRRLRVGIEDPGYPELRELLRLSGCEIVPISVDADGLPPEAVPGGLDLVCVSPSHQAPTGVTMPLERRKALLALAEEEDFLIVEDDYDFEMSFLKPANPALKSLDDTGRVIYVGSFSKSLFPGLRLGYLHADAPFVDEARTLRALILRHPPGTTQRTTAHFLALGHYNAHMRRMRSAFRTRRTVMEEALQAERIRVAAASTYGGAVFWLRGPEGLDSLELARSLREDGVLIEPGAAFYASEAPPRHFFRMAYSSIDVARIPEGVARVAARLRAG